ncbi:hypothetical protein LY90DRAFT_665882 [Neocallimastix californiae]|uniref:G-protein coupled receptors family 3 profile domain-containing protein n=1 Tax=Neocallimastix californiae TaxID=1754190 RepID=A0A1Y2EVJ4_9FUNG|nr:hypothetical protein LY90DRAFT_665882 [Neocallimastix californiae]|eukprot:ORY75589.1 hypothetical protein LY90DRAFT_665882 [Neocallimastix californiae]
MKQPDMPDNIPREEWERYRKELNNYFIEKTKNHEILNNYEIDIYFYPYLPVESSGQPVALNYMNDLASKLSKKEYDFVVMDERILFNEMALMESPLILSEINYRQPSLELLHDLSKYINKKDLEFHDPKILSYGIYENKIIGIPFEYDFDVLYYHGKDEKYSKSYNDTQLLLQNMENYTWNDLIKQMESNAQPLRVAFGDDNDLLNFVIEYTSNHYNLSPEYDSNYMDLFTNKSSTNYYTEFRDLVRTFSEKNNARNAALTSLDDAYNYFKKNNSSFFKAKASHHYIFRSEYSNYEIPLSLPPKYQTATTHKYLVANKFSKINPELLAEIALILTDKDAQLFRAKNFGSIPTFDFSKMDTDQDLQNYCQDNPILCQVMEKMKKLYIRDIFKSDTMVPFFEILYLIPIRFKNYFITNDLDYIKFSLTNVYKFITDHLGIYGILSILVSTITILFFTFYIYMTIKLKNHPYMKVISPIFCNFIVLGCILNLIKVLKFIPPYSLLKIKLFLIIDTLGTNLIYIPMFAVAYRIYRIYKTKTLIVYTLNNKRLFIIVFSVIFLAVLYRIIIVFTCRFYYESIGSFIALIFMIVATGSHSKKFGDICYTFVIFSTNISDYIVGRLITRLDGGDNYPLFFFITIIFSCLLHFICVYTLVGSRILLLMRGSRNYSNSSTTNDSSDATQYIALRPGIRIMSIIKRFSIFNIEK